MLDILMPSLPLVATLVLATDGSAKRKWHREKKMFEPNQKPAKP